MAEGKVITITGVPGVGTRAFTHRYESLPDLAVKVYNTADIMHECATKHLGRNIPPENLLNLNEHVMRDIVNDAYERIINSLPSDRKQYDRILVDTHAQFLWNNTYSNASDWHLLRGLNTDMYVTLIDKPSTIRDRQGTIEDGQQNLDLKDILLWQNIEANITQGWASNYQRPMYVLPSAQDPRTIEALLKSAFLVYYQMPMTDVNSKENDMISGFKAQLLEVGGRVSGLPTPIIDPRDIDIETGEGLSPREREAINDHTVFRDMNWYIGEATTLVAFYPPGAPLSKGVSDESTRGHESGKDAFIIYSSERASPFMGLSKRLFKSDDEFLAFFEPYMRERVELYRR